MSLPNHTIAGCVKAAARQYFNKIKATSRPSISPYSTCHFALCPAFWGSFEPRRGRSSRLMRSGGRGWRSCIFSRRSCRWLMQYSRFQPKRCPLVVDFGLGKFLSNLGSYAYICRRLMGNALVRGSYSRHVCRIVIKSVALLVRITYYNTPCCDCSFLRVPIPMLCSKASP